ncbi:MAG: hypothetical protein Q8909_20135 [Bacteroidota bacterium]|nr:hypothetical protein [Bacteroidota bacterium]
MGKEYVYFHEPESAKLFIHEGKNFSIDPLVLTVIGVDEQMIEYAFKLSERILSVHGKYQSEITLSYLEEEYRKIFSL